MGTHRVLGDRLVVCESVTRLTDDVFSRLVDRSETLDELHDSLPDGIQTLAVVDAATGSCRMVCSIGSTRPCYWTWQKDNLLVSSSLKLLAAAGVALSFDDDTLPELCCYRVLIPPRTVASGISRVRFGEAVAIDCHSGSQTQRHLWQPPRLTADEASEDAIVEQVYKTLTAQTCNMTAAAEKPVTLMSGGLDSSAIGLVAKRECGAARSVSTSFDFANQTERETTYATTMADHLGLEHDVYRTNARRYLSSIVRAVGVAETPLDHLQSALLFDLFDHFRDSGTDLYLSGHFADKLFATDIQYAFARWQKIAPLLRSVGLEGPVKGLLRKLPGLPYSIKSMAQDFSADSSNPHSYLWAMREFSSMETVCTTMKTDRHGVMRSREELLTEHSNLAFPDLVPMIDAATSSIYSWSMLSESCGARFGSPFASIELSNYLMALPWNVQYRKGKHYLKALLRQHGVPESLINRPKLGFGFPVQYWALPDTLFQPLVDMAGEMFDARLLASLQVSDRSRANLLWNLLNVYLWKKIFEQGADPDDLASELLRRHDHLQKRLHRP
jgi:asparagine synthase (glutamine-hydrolysing)